MFDFLFTTLAFTPHGFCLSWAPFLLTITILGNLLTATAYIVIPFELAWLVWTKGAVQISLVKNSAIFLFIPFILLCGVSHQLDILTLWLPYYYLQGAWAMLTGVVSIVTAFALPFVITNRE